MDAGWTVPRETVTEGGRDGHESWTRWSRKVVKNERSTVNKKNLEMPNFKRYTSID